MVTNEPIREPAIEEHPDRPGPADARLAGYGVPVWALVGYYHVTGGDLARVAADYDLPEEAVKAALRYYERHRAAIDARLAANAAPAA